MNEYIKRFLLHFLFAVTIILGVATRSYLLPNHFTHCDDIGLAINMTWHDGVWGKFLTFREWTYAPFQYLFETPLISLADSYKSYIVLGRLPSFLVGIINVMLCHLLLKKLCNKMILVLLGDSLILLSWENIIYGSQMQPYLIALTFIFLQFFVLYLWIDGSWGKNNLLILTSFIGVISCYAHYQLFIFTFSFFIALYVYHLLIKKYETANKIVFISVISFCLCLPIFYVVLRYGLLERGLNWNTGINDMFLFDFYSQEDLINYIKYVLSFFTVNIVLIIKYFFTSNVTIISNFIAIILSLSTIYGLYRINKLKNNPYYLIGIYIDVVLILYLFLVLKGSLPLGPSRHNLVLFPIILLLSIWGLYKFLYEKLIAPRYLSSLPIGLIFLNVLSFCWVMSNEIHSRCNLLSEEKLTDLTLRYSPDAIIGIDGAQYDLQLMQFEGYKQKSRWMRYGMLEKYHRSDNNGIIVLLSDKKLCEANFSDSLCEEINKAIYINPSGSQAIVLYKEEDIRTAKIEYAKNYYDNKNNGLCLYIIDLKSNKFDNI